MEICLMTVNLSVFHNFVNAAKDKTKHMADKKHLPLVWCKQFRCSALAVALIKSICKISILPILKRTSRTSATACITRITSNSQKNDLEKYYRKNAISARSTKFTFLKSGLIPKTTFFNSKRERCPKSRKDSRSKTKDEDCLCIIYLFPLRGVQKKKLI